MSLDDPLVSEAIRTIADAINKRRTDVVHTVLTTAAESNSDGIGSVTPLQVILDHVDDKVGTCLHHATKAGCADIVRALLAAGANPSIRDRNCKTSYDLVPNEQMRNIYISELLQAVAHDGQLNHVKQLVTSGVDINAKDGSPKANTALHFAATYANADMIHCLCEHGADVTICNGDGVTPLQDAMKRGDANVIMALVEHSTRQQSGQPMNSVGGHSVISHLQPADSTAPLLHQMRSQHPQNEVCVTPTTPVNSILSSLAFDSTSKESSSNGSATGSCLNNILDGTGSDDGDSHVCVYPPPQLLVQHDGAFSIPSLLKVCIFSSQEPVVTIVQVWKRAELWFQLVGVELELSTEYQAGQTSLRCTVNAKLFDRHESYKLTVSSDKVMLNASDAAGLWYGIHTFMQLCRNYKKSSIPAVHISDWPCLSVRGVMIDVSGGRLPDVETLMGIIDTLSTVYKINRLQLRMTNKDVARPSGTTGTVPLYSSRDILALAEYCSSEFIELVPHFEDYTFHSTTLFWPPFRVLASSFSSSIVHVSNTPVVPLFSTCQYWLNGTETHRDIEQYVESGRALGVVKLQEVGDKAEPFCSHLTEMGLSFLLSTDSAVTNSVCYNWGQCVSNSRRAASLALQFGSPGILITDWSEHHCTAPLAIVLSAVAIGAGFAWTGPAQQAKLENQMISTLNRQVFLDSSNSIGKCIVGMAKASQLFSDQSNSCTTNTMPYLLLTAPSSIQLCLLSLDTVQSFLRLVRHCQKWLSASKLQCFQEEAVRLEVTLMLDIFTYTSKVAKAIMNYHKPATGSLAGSQLVDLSQVPATQRTDLANKLLGLIDTIRTIHRLRNQEVVGGQEGRVMEQLQQVAESLV